MSSDTEFLTIVPDGDFVLTLHNSEECQHAEGARFLVSSRQLRSVSKYYDNVLQVGSIFDRPIATDGRAHHAVEGFSLAAMYIVMLIAHLQAHLVPRQVTLALFIDIISFIRATQMELIASSYTNTWKAHLQKLEPSFQYGRDAVRWLYFARFTINWRAFRSMAVALMTRAPDQIDFLGLPFHPGVTGTCCDVVYIRHR
jgi:hypothetical protein